MRWECLDGVVVVRIEGAPDTRAFIQLLRDLMDDPDVARPVALLIDVRAASGGPAQHELRAVSEFFERHGEAFGVKGILVKSKLQYGLARVGQALSQNRGQDVEIFHDEATALGRLRVRAAAE